MYEGFGYSVYRRVLGGWCRACFCARCMHAPSRSRPSAPTPAAALRAAAAALHARARPRPARQTPFVPILLPPCNLLNLRPPFARLLLG
jgi:hypothetical protein